MIASKGLDVERLARALEAVLAPTLLLAKIRYPTGSTSLAVGIATEYGPLDCITDPEGRLRVRLLERLASERMWPDDPDETITITEVLRIIEETA